VAAVAVAWWEASPTIQRTFLASFNYPESQQLRAWVTFFVALHDLGKFDVRFQLKALEALAAAWRPLAKKDHGLSVRDITGFDHGWAGMAWANQEYRQWGKRDDPDREIWEQWQPWLAAVTGHHGDFYAPRMPGLILDTDEAIIDHDRNARSEFVTMLSCLFLEPAGLSLHDVPPACSPSAQSWLAGFCAVCDWIGSNMEVFAYQGPDAALANCLETRIKKIQDEAVLHRFGLRAKTIGYKGVNALLKINESPRGIQVEVDRSSHRQRENRSCAGLRLAATGSRRGRLHRICTATQATANAMLTRVEVFAVQLFGSANIVLTHGKRNFNEAFQRLALRCSPRARG
jgi:CRISPR-associated endonuclease/helicase Cas3